MVLVLYGLSVVSEGFVAAKFMDANVPRHPIWRWALIANAFSYLLVLATVATLAILPS
jgi:hypothetical protein